MLINVKMPTIVGILKFMSMINFVLSWVEHKKKFYNLGTRIHTVFNPDCKNMLTTGMLQANRIKIGEK